jgi:hypothetical protein
MSLNKTLDRLFDEIRREAKRNPNFAHRLDAVLRLHESRRDVPDEVLEEAARENKGPASGGQSRKTAKSRDEKPQATEASPAQPSLNPAGLYSRQGEAALAAALADLDLPALQALVHEHNLDPSGVAEDLDRDGLAAHILAQAKRRAERDDKMFDY